VHTTPRRNARYRAACVTRHHACGLLTAVAWGRVRAVPSTTGQPRNMSGMADGDFGSASGLGSRRLCSASSNDEHVLLLTVVWFQTIQRPSGILVAHQLSPALPRIGFDAASMSLR